MTTPPGASTSPEPMPVQLTRMEGTINLIAYQMTEVKDDIRAVGSRVDKHDDEIGELRLLVGAQIAASASWKSWLPILASLASVALALVLALAKVL